MSTTETYGGQAIIEGVMFKSKRALSFAVRKPDGKIHVEAKADVFNPGYVLRLPFVRGFVSLIRMMIIGTKVLTRSSEIAMGDEQSSSAQKSSVWLWVFTGLVFILSFALAMGIFKGIPFFSSVFVGSFFGFSNSLVLLIEGVIKLTVLLLYVYLISFMPDIKRVFMYHGAEHKVIRAYEAGKSIIVENVRRASRFHPRCGTSFLVFVIAISVVVYTVIPTDVPLWLRFVQRLLLLPVVAGLSFEFLQFTARVQEISWLSWLKLPGYGVQLLTTREPTDDQIEVAIASFEAVRNYDAK